MVTRILTGIVGIALAAFIIQTGDWPFAAFALVLPLIGWYEYSKAFIKKGLRTAFILGILGITLIWGCAWLGNMEEMVAVVTGITLVTLLLTVFLHGRISPVEAGISVGGILYVGIPFAHLVMLRFLDDKMIATQMGGFELGCAYVWVMFIGTWASDTFAYFTGSAIGSHKLCPSISPNKTVEGFLGSVVGTTASIAALGHLFFGFPLPEMAVLGVLLSLFATLGDLVESVIKRHTGIKDSGSLIPGHGGVLDRFDSVLYTAPMVYYFALITQWMEK